MDLREREQQARERKDEKMLEILTQQHDQQQVIILQMQQDNQALLLLIDNLKEKINLQVIELIFLYNYIPKVGWEAYAGNKKIAKSCKRQQVHS